MLEEFTAIRSGRSMHGLHIVRNEALIYTFEVTRFPERIFRDRNFFLNCVEQIFHRLPTDPFLFFASFVETIAINLFKVPDEHLEHAFSLVFIPAASFIKHL